MATPNKFNTFTKNVFEKAINCSSDTLKVMLSNTLPVAANAVKADITEIAAGNGYSAGGATASLVSSAQASGTYKLVLGSVTFTASGGSIAPFQYLILYDSTPSGGLLMLWYDYGSALTLTSGLSLVVTFDATNGVLQAA